MTIISSLKSVAGKVGNVLNQPIYTGMGQVPDFGVSEFLTKISKPAYAAEQVLGTNTPGSVNNNIQTMYDQNNYIPSTSNNGFYNSRTTPPNNNSTNNSSNGLNNAVNTLNGQQSQGLDFIEQDYNNALGALAGQEQGLRGQADIASGEITQGVASTGNELRNAQSGKEADIQNQVNVSETGGKNAMQQARDIYRQSQQQNIAQLSALGISSSSVSEALAERLGVETARRIAGITGSIQEVRDNAAKELTRTREYYQGKLTELDQWATNEKAKIQNSLMQGLNQINSARNQAATDKSRSRAELINNVQSAIQNLTAQQQQFQQSLQAWAQQKSASLTPLVTDPNFLQSLENTSNVLNQKFAPPGLAYAPEFSQNGQGQLSGQVSYRLQKSGKQNPYSPGTQEYQDFEALQGL